MFRATLITQQMVKYCKYLMDKITILERELERTTQIFQSKLNQQKMETEMEVELQKCIKIVGIHES